LERAQEEGASEAELGRIHYQLGLALRKLGAAPEAATHLAEARRMADDGPDSAREGTTMDPTGAAPQNAAATVARPSEASPLAKLRPSERLELKRRVRAGLTRAYLNLGVLEAKGERFSQAAELFEKAAGIDPDFPQVQYSLGVAHFNARQFDKATGPLARALLASPQDTGLKRMLAMAWLNSGVYDKAAELFGGDPELSADPSLQFAYGLALVRSDRAAEAERIFSRLLTQHGDSAELSVLLGQAHGQQGDYDSAIAALKRALQLKADVAEAHATLGVIYLKQGRLAEAEQALRAELKGHPDDIKTSQNLAIVLDLEGRGGEALPLLRAVLKSSPEFADGRYLLGKILLAQGAATEAVEQLEAAARLAPQDANIHYQLGKAYQKQGRSDLAQQQFDLFRQLKDKSRSEAP